MIYTYTLQMNMMDLMCGMAMCMCGMVFCAGKTSDRFICCVDCG